MKKIAFCALCASLLSLPACQHEKLVPQAPENLLPCIDKTYTQRLVRTLTTHFVPGSGFSPWQSENRYFYDSQGRLDSLVEGDQATKLLYANNGKVAQALHYSASDPDKVTANTFFNYEDGRLVLRITAYSTGLAPTATHFKWGSDGHLSGYWYEGYNDTYRCTTDDCGNITESRAFYNANNEEHYFSVAEHDTERHSPFAVMGLIHLYPERYSVHNLTMSQIVHWDCTFDYDPSPVHTVYTYNAEGLPTQSESPYQKTVYYYQ